MIFLKTNLVLAGMCLIYSIIRLAVKHFCSRDKYWLDRLFISTGVLLLPLMLGVQKCGICRISKGTAGIISQLPAKSLTQNIRMAQWGMTAAFGAGMAIFLFLFLRYCYESKVLQAAVPVEKEVSGELCLEGSGINRYRILLSDRINAPVTWGFVRPRILIPSYLETDCRESYTQIVLHEYIHAKRRDNLWKFLALFLLCMYWQHPYLWFFYFTFLKEVELSCDEEVLLRIGEDGKAAYAGTLVAFAGLYRRFSQMASPLSSGSLKRRVTAIMNYKKSSRKAGYARKILMGSIVLSFALLLGYSNQIFAGMRDGGALENIVEVNKDTDKEGTETLKEISGNGTETLVLQKDAEEISYLQEENAKDAALQEETFAEELQEIPAAEAEKATLQETKEEVESLKAAESASLQPEAAEGVLLPSMQEAE